MPAKKATKVIKVAKVTKAPVKKTKQTEYAVESFNLQGKNDDVKLIGYRVLHAATPKAAVEEALREQRKLPTPHYYFAVVQERKQTSKPKVVSVYDSFRDVGQAKAEKINKLFQVAIKYKFNSSKGLVEFAKGLNVHVPVSVSNPRKNIK